MSPDRQRYEGLIMELSHEQLEQMVGDPALAYSCGDPEAPYLLHAVLRLGKGRLLIAAGIHVPTKGTAWKSTEVNHDRRTATIRPIQEQELELLQSKHYQEERVTPAMFETMIRALTGNLPEPTVH